MGTASVGCMILAIYKLQLFIRYHGVEFSLTQITLILQILANLERLVFVLDPVQDSGRGFLTFGAFSVLWTLSFPWSLACTLLISLYWYETLKNFSETQVKIKVTPLRKMKIPYIIIVTILVVLDLASSLIRAFRFPFTQIDYVNILLYLLAVAAISIFFVYSGIKILRFISNTQSSQALRVRRMTILIATSGACGLLFLFGFLYYLIEIVMTGKPSPAGEFLIFLSLAGISLSEIMVFQNPGSKDKSGETQITDTELRSKNSSSEDTDQVDKPKQTV
jgi:glucan phosphoethanolaminetransferase (alkaline phosphatase superfamily)